MSERTVLIASSDRLFADAASAFMGGQPGWRVVGREMDGVAAVASVARQRPDAVLILGEVGRVGAAGLAREVRRRRSDSAVVVVGDGHSADATVLPRDATAEEILAALLQERVRTETQPSQATGEGVALLKTLTRQELIVLRFLAEGLSMREIATRRGVSQNTVRTHIQNLYAKLGCHNRVEVVHFANRHGVVGYHGGPGG
jgi:DNA-binding NarL/FixJ family response regulator